jgi:hypothetical protein
MMRDALGLGASGRRSLGSGLVSIELRDQSQPHCTLDQTVFGLAT